MKPLVVWGISLGKTRCIVAAANKTAAARAFGCSLYTFNQYAADSGNGDDLATALAKPGQVFLKPIDDWKPGGWIEAAGWSTQMPWPDTEGES